MSRNQNTWTELIIHTWSNGVLCFEFLSNNIPNIPNVYPRQLPTAEAYRGLYPQAPSPNS